MDRKEVEEVMCIRDAACGFVALAGTKIEATNVTYLMSYNQGGFLVIFSEPDPQRDSETEYSHEVHIWERDHQVLSMRWNDESGRHMLDHYDSGPWVDSLMAKALQSITIN